MKTIAPLPRDRHRLAVISAALIVAIVPMAVLIALFQERVVGGLTQGGLKG